jgi:hypothetical protein
VVCGTGKKDDGDVAHGACCIPKVSKPEGGAALPRRGNRGDRGGENGPTSAYGGRAARAAGATLWGRSARHSGDAAGQRQRIPYLNVSRGYGTSQ